jgi:hypothetical protein
MKPPAEPKFDTPDAQLLDGAAQPGLVTRI